MRGDCPGFSLGCPRFKQGKGTILHIGGFGDGRLAFPYYSVDAAACSGLFTFIESVNREINNKNIKVIYFCPSPADTKSERPYHKLWKDMGVKIESPEKVAEKILRTIIKQKQTYIMGGIVNAIGIKINNISKNLAEFLFLKDYSKKITAYFKGVNK